MTVAMRQFDICYEPRTAIKDQTLVDFILETTRVAEEQVWELYADGSAIRH